MDKLTCPNCGKPTLPGSFCMNCGSPLGAAPDGVGVPPAPPAGQVYQQVAYQRPAAPSGGSNMKWVVIAIVALLVAVAVGLTLAFTLGGSDDQSGSSTAAEDTDDRSSDSNKNPETVTGIVVPVPPGFEQGDSSMSAVLGEALSQYSGFQVDSFYTDSGMSNMIIAFSFDSGGADIGLPEDATVSEMQEYIDDNKQKLLDQFAYGFTLSGAGDADVSTMRAFQTKSGDVGVEIALGTSESSMLGGMGMDILIFPKGDTAYMVMFMGMAGPPPSSTVDFLKQKISFE